MMKKSISFLLIISIVFSLFTIGVCAGTEPGHTFIDAFSRYRYTGNGLSVPGLPKTIKATWDYDETLAEIYRELPEYGDDGIIFPLAEDYGELYNVNYRFDGTVLSFEYTLKNGVALNDYLDVLDAKNAASGLGKVSREAGANHSFPLVNVALKLNITTEIGVTMLKVTDVVADDGTVLFKDGVKTGTGYGYQGDFLMPIAVPQDPSDTDDPTEPRAFLCKDKLLSQFGIDESRLTEYDEFYEHKDKNGVTDWVLVRAATQKQTSPLYTSPRYFEFGNRVMETEYGGEPFAFDVGVFSVKRDRFIELSDPEIYELDDIERVWTDLGPGRLMGDMNGDNILDVIDATLIQRCEAELMDYPADDENEPIDMVANPIRYFSDFNQDGDRDIIDATAIQRFLIGVRYRSAGWTPYPHNTQPSESDPTEPTEQRPTEPTTPSEPDIPEDIPRITGFSSIGKGVEIKLSSVPGAEKYRVYYYGSKGWTSMGETSGNTFIDDDVNIGSTYRYTVRCIKADLSGFTSDFYAKGWTYTYDPHLDTPKITRVEALDGGGVKISWNSVDGADLYRAYYKHNGWTKIADTRDTSCVFKNISQGMALTFTVRCLSCKGKGFASGFDQAGTDFRLEYEPDISNIAVHMDGVYFIANGNGCPGKIRVYRKTAGTGWSRIGDVDPYSAFTDVDVEPGKTYTYTARCLSEDGKYFISDYIHSGWTVSYKLEDCIPEFEFAIYNKDGDDNMLLVQVKDDNKFGIKNFAVDVIDVNDYMGTYIIGDEPCYLRADFWKAGRSYKFYLAGLDDNGNVITSVDEDGVYIWTLTPPSDLKAERIGDRKYRFSWDRSAQYCTGYNLNLYTADGEPVIDSDLIYGMLNTSYEVDLSDYPEDTEWICIVWSAMENNPSVSMPISLNFKEADYR